MRWVSRRQFCTSAIPMPSARSSRPTTSIEPVERFQQSLVAGFDVTSTALGACYLRDYSHPWPFGSGLHPPRRGAGYPRRLRRGRILRKAGKGRRRPFPSNPAAITGTAACSSGGAIPSSRNFPPSARLTSRPDADRRRLGTPQQEAVLARGLSPPAQNQPSTMP